MGGWGPMAFYKTVATRFATVRRICRFSKAFLYWTLKTTVSPSIGWTENFGLRIARIVPSITRGSITMQLLQRPSINPAGLEIVGHSI
jgi:hypothetical protein